MYVFFAFHQEIVNIFFEQNQYCPPNYALSQFLWFDRLNNLTKICANATKLTLFVYIYATSPWLLYLFKNQAHTFVESLADNIL